MPRSRLALIAVLVPLGLLAAGCGRLDRDAVQTEVQNVESAAAEGAMVAYEVEHGRTFRSFALIRTAELHKVSMKAWETLNETTAEHGLEGRRRRGIRLADEATGLLQRLHARPTDQRVARQVRLRLDQLRGDASDLAGEL
jgi:hypothetical protein